MPATIAAGNPYTWQHQVTNGAHTFTAVATYADGSVVTSVPVTATGATLALSTNNTWQPNPAYVGQVITGPVTASMTGLPSGSPNATFVTYEYTTFGVWMSPDGGTTAFAPARTGSALVWIDNGDPAATFNASFPNAGYYILEVTCTATVYSSSTGAAIGTLTGPGFVGGTASDLPNGGLTPNIARIGGALGAHYGFGLALLGIEILAPTVVLKVGVDYKDDCLVAASPGVSSTGALLPGGTTHCTAQWSNYFGPAQNITIGITPSGTNSQGVAPTGTVTVATQQPIALPANSTVPAKFDIMGGQGSAFAGDVVLTPMCNGVACGAPVPVTVYYFANGLVTALPLNENTTRTTMPYVITQADGFREVDGPAVMLSAQVEILPQDMPDSSRLDHLHFGIEQNVIDEDVKATYGPSEITWPHGSKGGDSAFEPETEQIISNRKGAYIDGNPSAGAANTEPFYFDSTRPTPGQGPIKDQTSDMPNIAAVLLPDIQVTCDIVNDMTITHEPATVEYDLTSGLVDAGNNPICEASYSAKFVDWAVVDAAPPGDPHPNIIYRSPPRGWQLNVSSGQANQYATPWTPVLHGVPIDYGELIGKLPNPKPIPGPPAATLHPPGTTP